MQQAQDPAQTFWPPRHVIYVVYSPACPCGARKHAQPHQTDHFASLANVALPVFGLAVTVQLYGTIDKGNIYLVMSFTSS